MPQPAFADHPAHARKMIDAALEAADPFKAVVRAWGLARGDDKPAQSCVLVAAGKASVAMARAAVERCGVKPVAGIIVVPAGSICPPSLSVGGMGGLRIMEADHPLPWQRNLIAAQAVLDAARIAASRHLPLVAMLSGGASAHLTFPERGMTLSDVRIVTDALLRSGANIREINTVRKHIERLKGGNLARAAGPSPVFGFILADVLGEPPPLDVIASGPTAPDPSTFQDALDVLARRAISVPAPVMEHLRLGVKGKVAETLKDSEASCGRIHNCVVCSNGEAVAAAADAAKALGFRVAEARLNVEGEAREVGEALADRVLRLRPETTGPLAVIWGGETTVTVQGSGAGGRNQEVALAAAARLADHQNVAAASFGTDGVDGVAPPGHQPAAGGIVNGQTAGAARSALLDLHQGLAENDSFAILARLRAQISTGPTGTNVNDLMIGLAY